MIADVEPDSFAAEARAYFFDADGRPLPAGYRLKNPALADTFEAIARDGPRAFYEGAIARDIAATVQNDPRKPGSLTAEDLARYRAIEREPVCVPYRASSRVRHGPVLVGRRHRGPGARPHRAFRPRLRAARRRAPPISSSRPSGSLSPIARATSPTRTSFPCLSRDCSIPTISPSGAR